MLTYPPTLPCVSRIEGHATQGYTAVVRTPMQAGNARQRRTHRALPQRLTLAFVVDQAVYATWLSWVNAHCYSGFVLMSLPGVLASAAGAPTTATPVRFVSDIQAELLAVHRLWVWRTRVDAEWLP
jgi:hypothetical protein